jgi:hypothetical protein
MNSKNFIKFALIILSFSAPLAKADEIIYQLDAATFGMTLLSGTLGFNTALNGGEGNFDMFDLTISGANGGDSFPQYSHINGEYTQASAAANGGISFANNEIQFTQYLNAQPSTERVIVDLLFANPVTASTQIAQIISRTSQIGTVLASDIAYFNPTTNANTIVGLTSSSASISAVPLPAAVWLFGAGLMGLLYKGKSKQKFA